MGVSVEPTGMPEELWYIPEKTLANRNPKAYTMELVAGLRRNYELALYMAQAMGNDLAMKQFVKEAKRILKESQALSEEDQGEYKIWVGRIDKDNWAPALYLRTRPDLLAHWAELAIRIVSKETQIQKIWEQTGSSGDHKIVALNAILLHSSGETGHVMEFGVMLGPEGLKEIIQKAANYSGKEAETVRRIGLFWKMLVREEFREALKKACDKELLQTLLLVDNKEVRLVGMSFMKELGKKVEKKIEKKGPSKAQRKA